ncbi:unnamed protein product [Thelazia callipaeda]|uniref:N(6)-L-threonylcarbamoyladenine synthase n=1 Tax=Thelazia callipaeda TaxID=103827 RepID=A0A0N5CZZ3_THECL|nr:unnamed protein product [Thelazia callipaeda]
MVSCDDTAVCILKSSKEILSSRRYANRDVQKRLGGICPAVAADQHRSYIERFVDECLNESGMRLCDLSGLAVTTKPGLVISLRVGVSKAVSLAKKGRLPLISVHHMQAHATIATLLKPILYPYVSLLISGGHCIIAVTNGPDDFDVLLFSISGSPGECLDKIGRSLDFTDPELLHMHPGAALEVMASRHVRTFCPLYKLYCFHYPAHFYHRYLIDIERFLKMTLHFNFSWIKSAYLVKISKHCNVNVPDFCASVQHSVASYLAEKLRHCLQYLNESNKIPVCNRLVFVSGGVASNKYILSMLRNVCESLGYNIFAPPPMYCCDNAEMIAWNGQQLLAKRAASIISAEKIPPSILVSSRSPIGIDISSELRRYLKMPTETSAEVALRQRHTLRCL